MSKQIKYVRDPNTTPSAKETFWFIVIAILILFVVIPLVGGPAIP